jgi:crotonobetainyl-CoA:carnitine CoA-transferase CaiB-like acyl-CoA transferase
MREDTHHAPHIGEQTREILAELGYADDDIEVMVKAGAVIEPEAR